MDDRPVRDFKRLQVWHRANRLAVAVYRLLDGMPTRHRITLGDQISRAALSIPSNIAEGAGRASLAEFRRFLTIALGSAAELESQLHFLADAELASRAEIAELTDELHGVQRQLTALRRNINH